MEAIAKQKYLKGSPRKARLVIDLIRGRNVSQALAILKFTNKRAAEPIAKCLNSAIANATYLAEQQNIAIDPDDLWVRTCFVDMGPTKNRRRMRPAPQGRAYREQRHYCHITIQVTSEAQAKAEEKEFVKRGKKVTAKLEGKSKPETKSAKKTEKKDAAEELKETKTTETTEEVKVEETTVDTSTDAVPETVTETTTEETPFENKPIAAQTDEEKSGSDMADDAKIDKVEDLERQ